LTTNLSRRIGHAGSFTKSAVYKQTLINLANSMPGINVFVTIRYHLCTHIRMILCFIESGTDFLFFGWFFSLEV